MYILHYSYRLHYTVAIKPCNIHTCQSTWDERDVMGNYMYQEGMGGGDIECRGLPYKLVGVFPSIVPL